MVDIFDRLSNNAGGPIGQYMSAVHGYFAFPKLEGELGPHMMFRGKPVLNWSLNNYLGLANHPEVREADAAGAAQFGMAAPMDARIMSGQTKWHEELERRLRGRGTEPEEVIQKRMKTSQYELSRAFRYQYIVLNDEVEKAVDRIITIIDAEHMRYSRMENTILEVLKDVSTQ